MEKYEAIFNESTENDMKKITAYFQSITELLKKNIITLDLLPQPISGSRLLVI